jgi:hypothetical protein
LAGNGRLGRRTSSVGWRIWVLTFGGGGGVVWCVVLFFFLAVGMVFLLRKPTRPNPDKTQRRKRSTLSGCPLGKGNTTGFARQTERSDNPPKKNKEKRIENRGNRGNRG